MSTLVNARGNKSCYSHVHCIPDELHPLDTLGHLAPLSHEQEASIEKVRFSRDDLRPTLPFARLPRIGRSHGGLWPRLVGHAHLGRHA